MRAETEKLLKSWKKKTITRSELESLLRPGSDAGLSALAAEAVSAGLLSPVRASGTDGNRVCPVWLKYRVTRKEDYTEELSEIALLHPALLRTGLLQSSPELYRNCREQLLQLNGYLFHRSKIPVSRKERSFEIFGEEKQLEDSSFRNLLERLSVTQEVLGCYATPEFCFHDYIPVRKTRMTLLICENKDIWFNIRRRMYEDGADRIFGTEIDGAVYGCGNQISEAGALTEYTRFMGAEQVRYLYWGDIDRAGLDIFLSLLKNNSGPDIRLFVPAYEEMLRLSENRRLPESADHRNHPGDYGQIYSLFSEEQGKRLAALIGENRRIPQEIISYETLLTVMR